MLPEQKAWRRFARIPNQEQVPDVRMLNAFREELGVEAAILILTWRALARGWR
jgi:hypothetical protein